MQNSNLNELAKTLNGMKNPKRIGTSIGEVIKDDPFTVSIADGRVQLEKGAELILTETVKNKSPQVKDKLLVVPTANEQTWVAIDRISEE